MGPITILKSCCIQLVVRAFQSTIQSCELLLVAIATVRHLPASTSRTTPRAKAQPEKDIAITAAISTQQQLSVATHLPPPWHTIPMEVGPALSLTLAALLSSSCRCHCPNMSLISASLRRSSGIPIISGRIACPGHGTAAGLRYATTCPHLCCCLPANAPLFRPSSRHVLCPWNGTASRCPAVQYSQPS